MRVTHSEISEAAGVSLSKVKSDVNRGKLDTGNLRAVAGYVVSSLMMGGIERVIGIISAEAIIPVGPALKENGSGQYVGKWRGRAMPVGVSLGIADIETEEEADGFSLAEEELMRNARANGNTVGIEKAIYSARKRYGVEELVGWQVEEIMGEQG